MYSRKPARTKTNGAQVLNTMRATGCEEVGVVDSGVGVVQAIDTLANSLSLARSSQPHPSLPPKPPSLNSAVDSGVGVVQESRYLPARSLPSFHGRKGACARARVHGAGLLARQCTP